MTDEELNALMTLKDCRTCKYGGIDEQFGLPLCHAGNCNNFEDYAVENSLSRIQATVAWFNEHNR